MPEWVGKDDKKHKGFIDIEDPYMALRKDEYPDNVDKLKMFNFKRDKVTAYERAQSAINQGLAIFPNSANARNELDFEYYTEDGALQVRHEKLSIEELAPLIEIDQMKDEIVAMQKIKTSNGNIKFELSADAKSRNGHDDRVDCAVMILNRLMELRGKEVLDVDTPESDYKNFFKKANTNSSDSKNNSIFGKSTNPFKTSSRNAFKR